VFALLALLRRPFGDAPATASVVHVAPEVEHAAPEVDNGSALIGVENSVDVTIDNNTVYGPGQLLDAKRVTGLRARGNRRLPDPRD
jgi:hypothetical protein